MLCLCPRVFIRVVVFFKTIGKLTFRTLSPSENTEQIHSVCACARDSPHVCALPQMCIRIKRGWDHFWFLPRRRRGLHILNILFRTFPELFTASMTWTDKTNLYNSWSYRKTFAQETTFYPDTHLLVLEPELEWSWWHHQSRPVSVRRNHLQTSASTWQISYPTSCTNTSLLLMQNKTTQPKYSHTISSYYPSSLVVLNGSRHITVSGTFLVSRRNLAGNQRKVTTIA